MARFFIILSLLAACAHAAQLSVQNARVSVLSSQGDQLRTEKLALSESKKIKPLVVGPTDTLKLSFSINEKLEDGKGVQPHQTFLRFYDEQTGEEGIQPVRVSPAGKGKFDLNMARPPTSLPPTSTAPLHVSLLIGSFVYDPLKIDLFDLVLPESAPPPTHPDEPHFHPQPEIQHTFRADPKSPPRIISLVFAGGVLAPWAVLLTLLANIPHKVPNLFSPNILPFIALLTAFEGLLLWYWVALRLGQVLAYGAIVGFFTVFAGNRALNAMAKQRVQGSK